MEHNKYIYKLTSGGDFLYSSITDILKINDTSILISKMNHQSNIVVGVPHHTPVGTFMMPCEDHIYGDQNTGYVGYNIAESLNCNFLCACNYFIDPNKKNNNNYSDYYVALEKCNPKYLVEIHGHGVEHCGNDIEISSGSKEDEFHAIKLKDEIRRIIGAQLEEDEINEDLRNLEKININADFNKIYYKASKSATIVDKRWISYHIELPLILRIEDNNGYLPKIGLKFVNILCKSIKNVCLY